MADNRQRVPLDTRIWWHIDQTDSCWLWTARTYKGYGRIDVRGAGPNGGLKTYQAHRLVYELLVGLVPDGLQLDHLCRVPQCVNPLHLELVTRAENLRRGIHANRSKTHCPFGHPYDAINTMREYARDGRRCRTCRMAEKERRRRAAGIPPRKPHTNYKRERTEMLAREELA